MLKNLFSIDLPSFRSQDSLQDERGFFQGLAEDLAREFKLENLTYAFEDRATLTIIFILLMAIVLVLIPIITAVYASGIKSFHKSLAQKLGGKLTLNTTFAGFPTFPIKIENGQFQSRSIAFETVQKPLYDPKFVYGLEYYKRRYAKILTHWHLAANVSDRTSITLRSRRFLPQGIPDTHKLITIPDPLTAQEFEMTSNMPELVQRIWDDNSFTWLHGKAKLLPGLTISLDHGMFYLNCAGPLKSNKQVEAILDTMKFCLNLEMNLNDPHIKK